MNSESANLTNGGTATRRLGYGLIIGVVLLPWLFVWFLLRKGYSMNARLFGFGWFFLIFVLPVWHIISITPMPRMITSDEDMTTERASITTPDAFDKCRPMIEARLARPETIDFNLSDTTLSEYGSDANFSITGTSENAFGTPMKFTASCNFEDGQLTNVDVGEG